MSSLSYIAIVRVLTKKCLMYGLVWFGMVWYGLIGGGECMMTSEFINEEISMLFCSKKFSGGWWVGGPKVIIVSVRVLYISLYRYVCL